MIFEKVGLLKLKLLKNAANQGLTFCELIELKYTIPLFALDVCTPSHTRDIKLQSWPKKINFTEVVGQFIWPNFSVKIGLFGQFQKVPSSSFHFQKRLPNYP